MVEPSEKLCTACDSTKLIDQFPKNAKCKGGREPRCYDREPRCYDCRKAGKKRPKASPGERKRTPPHGGTKAKKARQPAPEEAVVPDFMELETTTTYVINGADDARIALTADQLDQLVAWWQENRP